MQLYLNWPPGADRALIVGSVKLGLRCVLICLTKCPATLATTLPKERKSGNRWLLSKSENPNLILSTRPWTLSGRRGMTNWLSWPLKKTMSTVYPCLSVMLLRMK